MSSSSTATLHNHCRAFDHTHKLNVYTMHMHKQKLDEGENMQHVMDILSENDIKNLLHVIMQSVII